jgi:hypothetical protein
MKNILKTILLASSALVLMIACNKEAPLSFYTNGEPVQITLSTNQITPRVADSNRAQLVITFNNPRFATSLSNVKFVTQIDLKGNNFANPLTSTVIGSRIDSIQNKIINNFLLNRGAGFNQLVDLEVRAIGSYANNNDQQMSQVLGLKFRTYRVPPQVTPPITNQLFIVGDATAGWWNSNAPISQKFLRLDNTTYAAKINFEPGPGKAYLLLPKDDDSGWDLKYAIAVGSPASAAFGGRFGYRPSSSIWDANFPAPPAGGWHTLRFDFQSGLYTVTTTDTPVPDSLYAIGSATDGGWDNNVMNTNLRRQFLRRLNSVQFEANLNLRGGEMLKFITSIGRWQPQFGIGRSAGNLGFNYGNTGDPGVITVPPQSGMYKVEVNFLDMTYKLTKL